MFDKDFSIRFLAHLDKQCITLFTIQGGVRLYNDRSPSWTVELLYIQALDVAVSV